MAPRVATVCLVAVLVVSLFAAGSVPVEGDGSSDDWWIFVVHDHEDEDDERAHADQECNESDHDRGHGNDCDGDDEDNPGVGPGDIGGDDDDGIDLPIVQPTTPTPAPTTTPTATPSPTPGESDEPSAARDDENGGSNEAGPTAGDGETPDGDTPVVRNSSHEIGGFEAVRSISTNRSTVTAGEWVEIVVLVENVNDEPRSVVVDLTLFGEVVAVERVTVPPEATERVRFVQKFDAPGTYHPSVAGVGTTIRVEERPGTLAERTVGSPGQVGFGALAALLALVIGTLVARRG